MKIYTASKITLARGWANFRAEWTEHKFTSHWIDRVLAGEEASAMHPEYAQEVWIEDEEDIRRADVVLVLGTHGEHLRGALVEAGMGIALGKKIIVVGDHPDYGSWQFHPAVWPASNLEVARGLLRVWEMELTLCPRP